MKLYPVLFGLLACVIPVLPQAPPPPAPPASCGKIPSPIPSIIECPSANSDNSICTIPLSCLEYLQKNDVAAIRVYYGETIHWVSDLQDSKNNRMKFKFKDKLRRVSNSSDQDCIDDQPDAEPFDDEFPVAKHQKLALAKNAVVSMDAPQCGCYKHVIQVDGGDDIDPHIIIGGQPPFRKRGKRPMSGCVPRKEKQKSSLPAVQH